jgi:hypothetical protein
MRFDRVPRGLLATRSRVYKMRGARDSRAPARPTLRSRVTQRDARICTSGFVACRRKCCQVVVCHPPRGVCRAENGSHHGTVACRPSLALLWRVALSAARLWHVALLASLVMPKIMGLCGVSPFPCTAVARRPQCCEAVVCHPCRAEGI